MSADPFIRDTIANTSHCLLHGKFTPPKLQELSRLLIDPLKEALRELEPIKSVLLQMLEIRFFTLYYSPEARWDTPLSIRNRLWQLLNCTDIRTAAKTQSLEDFENYRCLQINAFTQDGQKSNEIRLRIDTLCDQLSREAYECIMAGLDEEIYQFGAVSGR